MLSATTYTLSTAIGLTAIANMPMQTLPFSSSNISYYGSNIATFGKNQDLCNITMDYIRVLDLLPPDVLSAGTMTYPNMNFIFHISGIEKDKGNLNGSRIV